MCIFKSPSIFSLQSFTLSLFSQSPTIPCQESHLLQTASDPTATFLAGYSFSQTCFQHVQSSHCCRFISSIPNVCFLWPACFTLCHCAVKAANIRSYLDENTYNWIFRYACNNVPKCIHGFDILGYTPPLRLTYSRVSKVWMQSLLKLWTLPWRTD